MPALSTPPCLGNAFVSRTLRRPRVLLAEDDDEMRLLMSRALRRDGYEVQAVHDGAALATCLAVSIAAGRAPDLIVSDVRMPALTGIERARRLRDRGCEVDIVLVSAFADEEMDREAREAGVAHLLSKPFDLDDLRTVGMHVLSRLGRARGA